jgi:hypothetical protein
VQSAARVSWSPKMIVTPRATNTFLTAASNISLIVVCSDCLSLSIALFSMHGHSGRKYPYLSHLPLRAMVPAPTWVDGRAPGVKSYPGVQVRPAAFNGHYSLHPEFVYAPLRAANTAATWVDGLAPGQLSHPDAQLRRAPFYGSHQQHLRGNHAPVGATVSISTWVESPAPGVPSKYDPQIGRGEFDCHRHQTPKSSRAPLYATVPVRTLVDGLAPGVHSCSDAEVRRGALGRDHNQYPRTTDMSLVAASPFPTSIVGTAPRESSHSDVQVRREAFDRHHQQFSLIKQSPLCDVSVYSMPNEGLVPGVPSQPDALDWWSAFDGQYQQFPPVSLAPLVAASVEPAPFENLSSVLAQHPETQTGWVKNGNQQQRSYHNIPLFHVANPIPAPVERRILAVESQPYIHARHADARDEALNAGRSVTVSPSYNDNSLLSRCRQCRALPEQFAFTNDFSRGSERHTVQEDSLNEQYFYYEQQSASCNQPVQLHKQPLPTDSSIGVRQISQNQPLGDIFPLAMPNQQQYVSAPAIFGLIDSGTVVGDQISLAGPMTDSMHAVLQRPQPLQNFQVQSQQNGSLFLPVSFQEIKAAGALIALHTRLNVLSSDRNSRSSHRNTVSGITKKRNVRTGSRKA